MSNKKLSAIYMLNWNIKLISMLFFVRNLFSYFPNEVLAANFNSTQTFLR